MLRNIFSKTIYERRRSLLWWGLGIIMLVAVLIGFYPAMNNPETSQQLAKAMEAMPKEMLAAFGVTDVANLTTPAGYIQGRLFGFMLPLIVMIFTIGLGSRVIAGEEEARTLDLILAHPIRRSTIVWQSFAALCVLSLAMGLITWLSLWLGVLLLDMQIGASELGAASFNMSLMALCFGAIALLIGAATGKRALSMAVATILAVIGYFANSLASVIDWLVPLQKLSPFYYADYNQPLKHGFHYLPFLVLGSVIVLCGFAAVKLFERRDVAV
ncbi:ABC transporter permease subunit [Herpetosiphon giganteus]|uniref:ABC transporter permease subunit n=1 Tax=Herpetosiphon giganteus TaxID=2029754 RepID=UPI001956F53D|nr:ABC transporter permease subunit [Herpetosiphon giganteus]MBM7843292.1 ABC-2 type transport system permease protein [Herpetosiphon giganteus]